MTKFASLRARVTSRLLRFKQPATTSRGVYTTHLSYFVHLTALYKGREVEGVGEASVLPDLSCDALPQNRYEELLTETCLWVEQEGRIPYERLTSFPSVLFAFETAFAQLEAGGSKALFNTPFARGEEGIPINGLVWMGSFDEMCVRVEQKLAQGFRCVKLKIGAIDFSQELHILQSLRARFSPSTLQIRVDANGAFHPHEAMDKLLALAPLSIHSIEQPIRAHQWDEMARLCRQSPLPIALDEELIGVHQSSDKEDLLQIIRPHYVVLKPSLHGGMKGCKEWITIAQQVGAKAWVTSALESNVGLNAIAHFAAVTLGPHLDFPQGLGTGLLYENNVASPLEIRGDQLWFCP